MAGNINSILKQGFDFIKKMEKKKLILICAVLLTVIAGGIIGAILLNRTNYTVLYSNLSAEEAGKIIEVLDQKGVISKVKGSSILVPEDQADELRIELAGEGYPSTGLNYDIFSNSASLMSTDAEELTYKQFQLQENMRTTISKMNKVKDCIVIVNLETSSSFVVSNNTSPARVSIELQLKDGETLTNSEAKSIAKFAKTCVPNLEMENISIVDTDMNYYNVSSDDNSESSATQQELTKEMKQTLSDQLKNVLEPAIGSENLAVSVNLDLNFDSKTVNSVEFSPPVDGDTKGLIRSSEEIYNAVNGDSEASGKAGTDSNGTGASKYQSQDTSDSTDSGNYDNKYNYELNKVETEIKKAQGSVENLSVSVLINSNVDGISDHLDTIKSLVANAIGVDQNYITVGLMPFVQNSGKAGFDNYLKQNEEIAKTYSNASLIRTGIIAGVILLLGLLTILILKKKKSEKDEETEEAVNLPVAGIDSKEEKRLLMDLVSKQTGETKKVEELMDQYPDAAVQILRNWLTED